MSLMDKIVGRFKAQLGAQFLVAIFGALLTIGLARLLTPDLYGLLFLALAVESVFGLVARMGIGRSAGRYIAEFKETDPAQVPFIVRDSFLFNLATIFVMALALAVSHRYIAELLDEPALVPFLILGVFLVGFGATTSFLEKILQGLEEITFVALLRVFSSACRLLLVFALVLGTFGAIGAMWGYVLSAAITNLLGGIYVIRRVRRFRETSATVEPGLRRRIAEYAVPITATNTSKILDKRVDTLLVGFFLTPADVSFYELAISVVSFVETPMSALGFTISPTLGSQKAADNLEEISRIYESALVKGLMLYIPAGAGLALVAEPLIVLLFGTAYTEAGVVLQVLGIFVVLKSITKITANGLDYLGRARERAIARGVTAVLNVGLNIVLIPLLGVVGAAVATVITYGAYTGVNLVIVAQELRMRPGYLARQVGLIAVITGIMSAIVSVLTPYITGWITLLLVVATGGAVWAALTVGTGLMSVKEVRTFVG